MQNAKEWLSNPSFSYFHELSSANPAPDYSSYKSPHIRQEFKDGTAYTYRFRVHQYGPRIVIKVDFANKNSKHKSDDSSWQQCVHGLEIETSDTECVVLPYLSFRLVSRECVSIVFNFVIDYIVHHYPAARSISYNNVMDKHDKCLLKAMHFKNLEVCYSYKLY